MHHIVQYTIIWHMSLDMEPIIFLNQPLPTKLQLLNMSLYLITLHSLKTLSL